MHWKLPADKNRVHKHNNIALSCEQFHMLTVLIIEVSKHKQGNLYKPILKENATCIIHPLWTAKENSKIFSPNSRGLQT